ncbi:MAG: hypothetical protein WEC39_01150 [Patescibacteria group bacterium]
MKKVLGASLLALLAVLFFARLKSAARTSFHNGRPDWPWESQGLHL